MPSYVITGVSRGIGYEFLRQYSSDLSNTVIGLVRDKAATDKKVSEDADLKGRTNIHILQADLTNYDELKRAAADTSEITGGSLDYIIANAGFVPKFDAHDPIGVLGSQPEKLTQTFRELFEINVIANVHLVNLFMPLILTGEAKKIIVLSSGYADIALTNDYDVTAAPLYSASKAAVNVIVAKFSAQYKEDGVLFFAISPGVVDVGQFSAATEEHMEKVGKTVAKFLRYAPHFKGPATPEESVKDMRSVITNASIEKGNGGDFISHLGTKQWL